MMKNLFIFIGGSDEQNGDYSRVHRLAKSRGTANWSTLKNAQPGDRVLIYIQKPHSACIAKAEVLGYPAKGNPGDYPYRVKIGHFEMLPNRIVIGDLKKLFPDWNWLRYPRRGTLVPEHIAERFWRLVHQRQSGVQILISNATYGAKILERLDSTKKSKYWSVPKLTAVGDTIFFYVEHPTSAIIAVGSALSLPRATETKWYEARVGEIRKLKSPIKLDELREMFRDWAWLRSVNMFAYVSQERALALLKRAELGSKSGKNGKRDQHKQAHSSDGAGFGVPETNALVERAAIKKATYSLRSEGFIVRTRERDKIGYDLECHRKGEERHIEVKGTSGSELKFILTANEYKQSKNDPKFWIVAVTAARTKAAAIHSFSGDNFVQQFELRPLSYMAECRKP